LYGDFLSLENDVLATRGHPIWEEHAVSMLLSVGLSESIPRLIHLISKAIPGSQQVDTAMIPEVAYHEYTHIVLSRVFALSSSSALNEGFPNYYASKISGLTRLGAHLGKYVKGVAPKNSNSRATYSWDQDYKKWAAFGSFTLSLLVELDHAFGVEGQKIITAALDPSLLSSSSHLKPDLEAAIAESIRRVSKEPGLRLLQARAVFKSRGM
jgi:hypothetical protein